MRSHAWVTVLLIASAGLWNVYAGSNDSEGVKLVTTGLVEKVDAKHMTFQFKFYLDQPRAIWRNTYGRIPRCA